MDAMTPRDADEVAASVAAARADKAPMEIVGRGSKPGLGRPMQTARTLSVSNLSGISLYEPAELVIGAKAGTPVDDIVAALDAENQQLTFEPRNLAHLYGATGQGSIGSVAACNISGPRRISAGAARDSLIGVTAVTGRGETMSSGGRVMKNVTGYDLVKLYTGSFGTLGVLTEVIFKVLPKPETAGTIVFESLDERRAVDCLSRALGSPFEVSGAAHLPSRDGQVARTVIRMEGFASSVDYRLGELATELSDFGASMRLETSDADNLWRDIRDVRLLPLADETAIWQVSTAPSQGPDVAAAIRNATDADLFFDWGGGLLWIETQATDDASAAVRNAIADAGGHATLMRAPEPLRAHTGVFEPLAPGVMMLSKRLKDMFDPDGILNPGKMYQGV